METKEKLRKFKFVGTQEEADGYVTNIPQVGGVYYEHDVVGSESVVELASHPCENITKEWQEVFEEKETEKIRRFKYVGTQKEANNYKINIPQIGRVYQEDDIIGRANVAKFAKATKFSMFSISEEWQEVFEEEKPTMYQEDLFTDGKKQLFTSQVEKVLRSIRDLLLSKNQKYGNSALEPVRIFSKSTTSEQLLVRIDDKLSRIKTMGVDSQDEDTIDDLIGYLVLLKVSRMN